jgi:hypothetical protein
MAVEFELTALLAEHREIEGQLNKLELQQSRLVAENYRLARRVDRHLAVKQHQHRVLDALYRKVKAENVELRARIAELEAK